MRLDKVSTHRIKEGKFQRKYTIINWNQCKDEYNIHEFREQQRLNLMDENNLRKDDNRVTLCKHCVNHSIYYTRKNIKMS